jgi:hypothetical protein
MAAPTGVELPKHPEVSQAELHRGANSWAISFTGEEPFPGEEFTINADRLVEAGVDPTAERLVAPGDGLRGDTPAGGRLRHFAVGREAACRTGRLDPPTLRREADR